MSNYEPDSKPALSRPTSPWLRAAAKASDDWFASLTPADTDLSTAARLCLPRVCRQALARTLLALGREGLLPSVPPVKGTFQCTLPDSECTLICEGFESSMVLLRGDLHQLRACWSDSSEELIEHPARLLEIVASQRSEDIEPWQRLAMEITDSLHNEALALAAHHSTNVHLVSTLGDVTPNSLIRRLQQCGPSTDAALFLDQWAATGHPLHTVPKTRLGLAPAEALKLCPEFHPQVPVRLTAVRRDRVSAELPNNIPRLSDWFADWYPTWFEAWASALNAKGLEAADYEPFPVHPWQAENVIAKAPSELFTRGEIHLLDGPEMAMLPCLSVRSLVPSGQATIPGFKLALGVRLTSGMRTITPRSCHMGPRVSRLLKALFEQDSGFAGMACVLEESIGAHYNGADSSEDLKKHLSFIAREPISSHINSKQIAVPAAALAEPFPVEGPPLLLAIAANYGNPASDGLAVFEEYTTAFLNIVLRAYLVYGIALEAHGQNVLACYSEHGKLAKFLFRDFAGIRIHEPTLKRLGFELEVHSDRRTVVQDFADHPFWLRHRSYHCHLGHIAHGLSNASAHTEARYWRLAGDITSEVFDQLRSEVDPEHWKSTRYALLEEAWGAKASLSMRLTNQVRDLPFTALNPLKATGS